MLKTLIEETMCDAITKVASELNDLDINSDVLNTIRVERPKNPEHGDFAVNVSSLARYTKMAPPKIAETVLKGIEQPGVSATNIAGFVNIKLDDSYYSNALNTLLHQAHVGENDALRDDSILLEYISANPTGPLHIGHGRWAALGDSLVRIWRYCGATVTPEFYINDAGVQMNNIGIAVWLRALAVLKEQGEDITTPEIELPYPGEYVIDMAKTFLETNNGKKTILSIDATSPDVSELVPFIKEAMLAEQQRLLAQLGVEMEAWFSEKDMLHKRGLVEKMLEELKHGKFAYEDEGALWLRTEELGDEKDRVLVKTDGSYTYLSADIAYHHQKFSRKDVNDQPQYNRVVNIWGADHHGYIARMRAALQSLGHINDTGTDKKKVLDPKFEIILGQLVNLIVDGEKTRMGKRRKMLTLEDLVEEVGVDATRFWMIAKSVDTAIDFDVELASSKSNENPVFYAQYAHARCCSILRNAVSENPNVDTGETEKPKVSAETLKKFQGNVTPMALQRLFTDLDGDAQGQLHTLILKLDSFEDVVIDSAHHSAPHILARYVLDLAADFHSFYNVCRILTDDEEVTLPRLMLVRAVQKVTAQALSLLGVSAPESM